MTLHASQKGIVFEKWVSRLYDELGKINVKHNINVTKKGALSQIDIRYGIVKKQYVECKYHQRFSTKVGFEEVAKFASVLEINCIKKSQGTVVTNTQFDYRTQVFAQKTGITLIDRKALIRLDWKRTYQMRSWICLPSKRFAENLESRIFSYR